MKKCCWMFGIALWCWGILLATPAGAANALYESNFANGGKDWTAVDNATVSDVTRRPGGKSLADIGQSFETVQNRTLVKPPICLNPQP